MEGTPPTAPAAPEAQPSMADVMAASQRATEAATQASSAAEAAAAAVKTITESGLNLPQPMLDAIGVASSQAWEARMRELGALVEDNGDGIPTPAGVPDPTGGAAAAVAAGVADAAAAVAGAVESPDDIIFPTMAHRALKQGVRRGDWGK